MSQRTYAALPGNYERQTAVVKQGQIFIAWRGKTVTTLSGKEAERFLVRIAGCDDRGAQLVMAKATGNFKHGNERR